MRSRDYEAAAIEAEHDGQWWLAARNWEMAARTADPIEIEPTEAEIIPFPAPNERRNATRRH